MSMLHPSQFTSRKVPYTTATILDDVVGDDTDLAGVDRFSMVNAKSGGGIDGQVRLSRDLFYEHDDTRVYAELPTDWFRDPKTDRRPCAQI